MKPFPPDPSDNILSDIFTKMITFPVHYRKEVCKALNWDIVKFFRVAKAKNKNGSAIPIENQQQKKIVLIAINELELFLNYIKRFYNN